MTELFGNPWFVWAIAVAVGLPVGLVLLTEIRNVAARRGSGLTRSLDLLRNYILPLGALLLLLIKVNEVPAEATPVRVLATTFGFVVLVLLLSGLNTTLFQGAPEGSWRQRIPAIFVDVARFVLIALGLAMIFSWVWGADVGGLFTALGVTSIVLGLALQNAVGQIISGLLLLFEQPFRIGDWVETGSARGRVVEVNWRATHIETGNGLQITPNSVLAGASFTNLSRPVGSHSISVTTAFSAGDPPDRVCAMLTEVAGHLPQLPADRVPKTSTVGAGEYRTGIPLHTPADDGPARAQFQRWIWYAARRANLHLDDADDDFPTPERLYEVVGEAASLLRLDTKEKETLAQTARLLRYGAEEPILNIGQVPDGMMYIAEGRVRIVTDGPDGTVVPVRTLEQGEFLGHTTLTREPVLAAAYAAGEVMLMYLDRAHIEETVMRNPRLLQDIGRTIEDRRSSVSKALAARG